MFSGSPVGSAAVSVAVLVGEWMAVTEATGCTRTWHRRRRWCRQPARRSNKRTAGRSGQRVALRRGGSSTIRSVRRSGVPAAHPELGDVGLLGGTDGTGPLPESPDSSKRPYGPGWSRRGPGGARTLSGEGRDTATGVWAESGQHVGRQSPVVPGVVHHGVGSVGGARSVCSATSARRCRRSDWPSGRSANGRWSPEQRVSSGRGRTVKSPAAAAAAGDDRPGHRLTRKRWRYGHCVLRRDRRCTIAGARRSRSSAYRSMAARTSSFR